MLDDGRNDGLNDGCKKSNVSWNVKFYQIFQVFRHYKMKMK